MSWDIKQDLKTGDWSFDARRDILGVEAQALVQQRIHVRLMIERGEFMYDSTGTLGSRLRTVLAMNIGQGFSATEQLIREALQPMEDIAIKSINVFRAGDGTNKVSDPRVLLAEIKYNVMLSLDGDVTSGLTGSGTANVTIPIS